MAETEPDNAIPPEPEARWPALLAVVAAALLYATLPQHLSLGPRWLLPAVAGVLTTVAFATHKMAYHAGSIVLGHVLSAVVTIFMLWSVGHLIAGLPTHEESSGVLLRSAAGLWGTNVIVFALWYWR